MSFHMLTVCAIQIQKGSKPLPNISLALDVAKGAVSVYGLNGLLGSVLWSARDISFAEYYSRDIKIHLAKGFIVWFRFNTAKTRQAVTSLMEGMGIRLEKRTLFSYMSSSAASPKARNIIIEFTMTYAHKEDMCELDLGSKHLTCISKTTGMELFSFDTSFISFCVIDLLVVHVMLVNGKYFSITLKFHKDIHPIVRFINQNKIKVVQGDLRLCGSINELYRVEDLDVAAQLGGSFSALDSTD